MQSIPKILQGFLWLYLTSCCALQAQQPVKSGGVDYPVFIDKADDLGNITVFQSKENPNHYYYLPNQVRVKSNQAGTLQMGFQQYVKNEKSSHLDEETRTKGAGGGYFWMVVGFGLSEEERQEAVQILQSRKPGAVLVGAMAYESGTATLLSFGVNGKDPAETVLLGCANAPLMDGDAIAVSMILDADNATKLWESFKLPVPGIGMNFSMNFRGYHSPVHAKITMDMDKIYKHQKMNVGVESTYLGAELEYLRSDLMNNGAIKVEQTGDMGRNWEAILQQVLTTFQRECFTPVTDATEMAIPDLNGQSPLDRAQALTAGKTAPIAGETAPTAGETAPTAGEAAPTGGQTAPTAGESAPTEGQTAPTEGQTTPTEGQTAPTEAKTTPTEAKTTPTEAETIPTEAATTPTGGQTVAPVPKTEEAKVSPLTTLQNKGVNAKKTAKAFNISIYAGFQLKKVRQRGQKVFELNKIRTAQRNRNIAMNLPRMPQSHLQQINVENPLYTQREIMTMIDGFSASDFGKYINFVNINLRKKHPQGAISTDEIVINRNNFNKEGNRFKLLYGWKPGDNDRKTWLDYEYKTVWSFFGGAEITEDWKSTQKGAINVAPPCRKEVIRLEGNADSLKQRQVRAVTVKIEYQVMDKKSQILKTFSLSKDEALAAEVEIIQPNHEFEYTYEVIWQLSGNKTITTGVKKGSSTTLFIDEFP